MSTGTRYPHLTVADDGSVRIGETRYKVTHLAAEHYHHGWSAEEILRQHPDLKPGEVYAALTYFYDHFDEVVASLQATADEADRRRGSESLSRSELLRRKASQET